MADGDTFSTNAGEVGRQLDEALSKAPAAVVSALAEALRRDGERWQSAMQESINGPLVLGRGKPRTSALATRRGSAGLKGSFFYAVQGDTFDTLQLRKFSTEPSAMLHEHGGTVVPRNGKWLAIPLPAAMTPSGVPREPGPRSYGDLAFIPSRRSSQYAFLARITHTLGASRQTGFDDDGAPKFSAKGKTQVEYLYLLAKSVTIPPRLGMEKTHRQQESERLADIGRLLVKYLANLDGGAAAPVAAPA